MTAITFDTYAFVKHLTASGFSEQQAEALAQEQLRLVEDKLATKQDLFTLRKNLEHDLKELEMRMIIKLGAMLVVAMSILATVMKVF